ncbi:hypothetical protein D3C71_284530 [compost metagenome]
MSQNLIARPISIINFNDKNIEAIHASSVVIACENIATNGKRYLDFGSLCYEVRAKRAKINKYTEYTGVRVDLKSFSANRLRVVSDLIEIARSMQRFASAIGFHATIKCFFDWLDAQEQKFSFADINSMTEAYINYSLHLLDRINSSGIRGSSIKAVTASGLQVAARQVVSVASGLHEKEITILAPIISQSDGGEHINLNRPSADVQARTFATLVNFIEEAHRVLVDGGEFPMRLVSPGSEPYFLYTMFQGSEKSKNARISIIQTLDNSPTFPTWEEIKSHFELSGPKWELFHIASNYESTKRRHVESNSNLRCSLRSQIANHAMTAAILSFIAATGCNLSVAQDLDIDSSEVVPSTQGHRFYGAKPRADGKNVAPEFGARFTPVFKKILELREWVLNGQECKLVFPILPKGSKTIGYIGTSAFHTLRRVFKRCHPGTTWVPPIQWRKNVSYQYLTSSGGDTIITSEKLGNTPQTLKKSYARPALDEFASQVSELFNAIHSAAIARTRHIDLIPVRITNEKFPSKITGVGNCDNESAFKPRRASGFTAEAPQPNCRDPETCLFCYFYAVHADEEDIRRLLSLRYIIQQTKGQHNHTHWQNKFGPTVHRIDEILTAISEQSGALKKSIDRIADEVETGDMDPFWAIHLDTMVYVGAVV